MSIAVGLTRIFAIVVVAGVALAACERRASDQAATQSSGAQSSRTESSGSSSSGNASMQRAERAVDDSVITTKAKSALLADTTVKGSEIHVETNKGIVILSGTVDNERQRERAASIVRGIDGVKSVQNKTTLKQ